MSAAMNGEPDPDVLAELTGRGMVRKQPAVDPVLGLVGPPTTPRTGKTAVPTPPAAQVDPAAQLHDGFRPFQAPSSASDGQPERKEKIGGWNGYPSNLARIRAAQWHTQTKPDGWPSLSEMTEQTLLAEARRLEEKHNRGRPFPDVPAGKVKHSRRSDG